MISHLVCCCIGCGLSVDQAGPVRAIDEGLDLRGSHFKAPRGVRRLSRSSRLGII